MRYIICDYYATGEGRSLFLMICPNTISDPMKQFASVFGDWFAIGAEEVTKEKFNEKYSHLAPEFVMKMINGDKGHYSYYSAFHYNLS